MSSRTSRLEFLLSLTDKVSGPISRISERFDNLQAHATSGLKKIGGGILGLTGTAMGIVGALQPAREIAAKIGEVSSLGVAAGELKNLENAALSASAVYGTSAADYIAASYDIQSAISGLKPGQLGVVTGAMNTLAIATKADTATMTSLMGSMYGIFQGAADKMGIDKFSERVASFTAKSVQMFKTTGKGMEDAFRSVGSLAQANGIAMANQFAVMGTLQATMPGAEAGTKYKAFLAGVMKAQGKLKMTFTDSRGAMLPMVDILEKIKNKYGDLSSAEIADLSKAFGSQEAVQVITGLIGKTDQLKSSIADINNSDFALVEKMAMAIADPFDKATAGVQSLTAKVGSLFLPQFNEVMEVIAKVTAKVTVWIDANPELASTLTKVGLGIAGVLAGLATLAIVVGVSQLAFAGFNALMIAATVLGKSWMIAIYAVNAAKKIAALSTAAWSSALAASRAIMLAVSINAHLLKTSTYAVSAAQKVAAASTFLQNKAMVAGRMAMAGLSTSAGILKAAMVLATSPIGLIVIAITGLVAAGLWLYNNWEMVKESLGKSEWGRSLLAVFETVKAGINGLINLFTGAFTSAINAVGSAWNSVVKHFSGMSWGDGIIEVFNLIFSPFRKFGLLVDGMQKVWGVATSALSKTSWGQPILNVIAKISGAIDKVLGAFKRLKSAAGEKITAVTEGFSNMKANASEKIDSAVNTVSNLSSSVATKITGFFSWGDDEGPKAGLPRARGGAVLPGHFHQVNELGPELLETNGQTYLMMGNSSGNIIPFGAQSGFSQISSTERVSNANNSSITSASADSVANSLIERINSSTERVSNASNSSVTSASAERLINQSSAYQTSSNDRFFNTERMIDISSSNSTISNIANTDKQLFNSASSDSNSLISQLSNADSLVNTLTQQQTTLSSSDSNTSRLSTDRLTETKNTGGLSSVKVKPVDIRSVMQSQNGNSKPANNRPTKSVSIAELHIHTTQTLDPHEFMEQLNQLA